MKKLTIYTAYSGREDVDGIPSWSEIASIKKLYT